MELTILQIVTLSVVMILIGYLIGIGTSPYQKGYEDAKRDILNYIKKYCEEHADTRDSSREG